MTANATNETIVLAAGQQVKKPLEGAQIVCTQATAEILVSMDQRGWLPFSRGIELNHPTGTFTDLYFLNDTGSEVTIEVVVIDKPGVYIDRRELAAQIAINGGVQVVNSPFTEEGGVISKLPTSSAGLFVNQPVSDDTQNVISVNTNGVIIKKLWMHIKIASTDANGVAGFYSTSPSVPLLVHKETGIYETEKEIYLPAGSQLNSFVETGAQVNLDAYYEIL